MHVPAWFLSLTLHLAVFLTLGLLVQGDRPHGNPDAEPDRHAGIVLVESSRGKVKYFSEDEAGSEASAATSEASPATKTLTATFPEASDMPLVDGPSLPTSSPPLASLEPPGMGDVPGATGLAKDNGSGGAGKGNDYDVETGVFGVKGRGSKFVYVFDRSASMSGFDGRPLRAAKRELIASLEQLRSVHQFQVIFYNQKPHLMTFAPSQQPVLLFADDNGKRQADSFIRSVVADGGTNHIDALKLALAMRPDVIFFLTDADEPRLTNHELAEIRERNLGTTISTVEYGAGPRQHRRTFLQDLAEQNGGQHRYVDITQLPRE